MSGQEIRGNQESPTEFNKDISQVQIVQHKSLPGVGDCRSENKTVSF